MRIRAELGVMMADKTRKGGRRREGKEKVTNCDWLWSWSDVTWMIYFGMPGGMKMKSPRVERPPRRSLSADPARHALLADKRVFGRSFE